MTQQGTGELNDLGLPLDRIESELSRRGRLGVISITVLQRESESDETAWEEYEGTLHEISRFLARYSRRRMRRGDRLLEPIQAGNTFLLLLDPPRRERELVLNDLGGVRERLERGVVSHLSQYLGRRAIERFGVHVGEALLRHDPAVDCRRIVFRSLEAALADAVRESRSQRRLLAAELARVLKRGRLRTVYQPVVDLERRQVIGFEALARPPGKQFQSPHLLFRAAQESGMLWDLERICRQSALDQMPALGESQLLFLNIEPDSMHDPKLSGEDFLRQIGLAGLQPGQLVLEVTEHVAVRDFPAFRRAIERARDLGFRVAMDDVGSGYAGLQAIAELSPDFLKVDMSLIRNLHKHPIKRELIATIRRFSDRTGIRVVAEGVELPEELESLAETGVRWAQGFLFAQPTGEPEPLDWTELLKKLGTRESVPRS